MSDSFAPSERRILTLSTQGSAKPPPWAKLFYAFGVVGATGAKAGGLVRHSPVPSMPYANKFGDGGLVRHSPAPQSCVLTSLATADLSAIAPPLNAVC
jgi:hypothetical protein